MEYGLGMEYGLRMEYASKMEYGSKVEVYCVLEIGHCLVGTRMHSYSIEEMGVRG